MAKRILAVDDSEDLLTLVAEALGDEGYDVVTCHRPRDAYGLAKSTRPDVILLDVLMPLMNGWEVLNLFLLDRELRIIPVILMTAAEADVRRKLARLEAHDISVLAKPFTLDQLLEYVDHALGQPNECEVLYDKISNLITPLTPLPRPTESTN